VGFRSGNGWNRLGRAGAPIHFCFGLRIAFSRRCMRSLCDEIPEVALHFPKVGCGLTSHLSGQCQGAESRWHRHGRPGHSGHVRQCQREQRLPNRYWWAVTRTDGRHERSCALVCGAHRTHQRQSGLLSWVYQSDHVQPARSAFRDISAPPGPANNSFNGTTGYPATAGWNACTGLGSANGTALQAGIQAAHSAPPAGGPEPSPSPSS